MQHIDTQLIGVQAYADSFIANPSTLDGGVAGQSYAFGLLWRLTRNQTYAFAGVRALLNAAGKADYCNACGGNCKTLEAQAGQNAGQRSASLCFGNLGAAISVGYDWLFDTMTADQRRSVVHFITTQLLNVYAQGLTRAYTASYWFRSEDNFNSVINSGALLAGLAVAGEDDVPYIGNSSTFGNSTKYAWDAIQIALLGLPHGAKSVYDDGSYPEGPGYGDFAITHHLLGVLGLKTATGYTFGLQVPGLSTGTRYYLDLHGPSLQTFNWADGGSGEGSWLPGSLCSLYVSANTTEGRAQHYWSRQMGLRISQAKCTAQNPQKPDREVHCSMVLLHFTAAGTAQDMEAIKPLSKSYPQSDLGFLRTGGFGVINRSADVTFVAMKGGNNALQQLAKGTTHTHADQGTFVLDMVGERWAVDFGSDNYFDYGYFSMQKFDWYFSGTAGHNTLMIDGHGQDACTDVPAQLPLFLDTSSPVSPDVTECRARIVEFNASEQKPYSIVDLSSSYATRGVHMLKRGFGIHKDSDHTKVIIRDEIQTSDPARSMSWNMHTPANVSLEVSDPLQATLTLKDPLTNKSVSITVFAHAEGCPTAAFTLVPATDFKPTGHGWVVGITNLVLKSQTVCTLIEVTIASHRTVGVDAKSSFPLSLWNTLGPFI